MHAEVATLPVVSSNGCKPIIRKIVQQTKIFQPANGKNQSASKHAANLLAKRKQLHPLLGGSYYKNNARIWSHSEPVNTSNKNPVGQRILSAKMLRVKELQNQLSDAHCHINELVNENRLLKALQKRQDSALRRYEGNNAELPRIINSHHEELRVLHTKHKKLRAQHKNTCDSLKEKENELHTLQAQNKHLLQLSKDRNLGEREKLQAQVSDLSHRIREQDDTIQLLHRKLALEGKSLKHQLNNEVAKHKETQRHLSQALEKLKALEELLDNREKKMYQSGQLPIFGKRKHIATQSLTNLTESSNAAHLIRSIGKAGDIIHNSQDELLPILTEPDTVVKAKVHDTNVNFSLESLSGGQKTETMTSLELVRKFRLQKSPHVHKLSARERLRERSRDLEVQNIENNENFSRVESPQKSYESYDRHDEGDSRTEIIKSEDDNEKKSSIGAYKLSREMEKAFVYSSSESDDEQVPPAERDEYGIIDSTVASKELHAKLTRKRFSDTEAKTRGETEIERGCTEEELDRFISEKLKFNSGSVAQIFPKRSYSKAEPKAVTDQLKSVNSIYESDLETDKDSELRKEEDKYHFLLTNAPNDSENDDPRHAIDEFLHFDINQSTSDSENETQNRRRKSITLNKRKVSNASECTDEKTAKSAEDDHESGKLRLMDISKSWSELQEKIMREREISDSQIKSLEGDLNDDLALEIKIGQTFGADPLEKTSTNVMQTLSSNNKEILRENMQDTTLPLDKPSQPGSQSRRHSISQDGMNSKEDAKEQKKKTEHSINKSFEYKLFQRRQSTIETNKRGTMEIPSDTTLFSQHSTSDDYISTSLERELNDLDMAQAKIESVVAELDKGRYDNRYRKGSSSTADVTTKRSVPLRFENSKKSVNSQQEAESTKRVNYVHKDGTYKEEISAEAKKINYNKEKLLAAMKAIDNNDNVEFLDLQKSQKSGGSSRSQITENLFRGIPTHTKKKDELMKELFGDNKSDTKSRNGCTKLH